MKGQALSGMKRQAVIEVRAIFEHSFRLCPQILPFISKIYQNIDIRGFKTSF